MKILMLTPYLPYPPSSGGQVRSYNLIKNLALRHEITLFSLIKKDEEKKYIKKFSGLCSEVKVFKRPPRPWTATSIIKTGFGLYPFLVVRNFSAEEKKAISEKLNEERFDLIHAETFYVMPHLPKIQTPIVLVEQTIEYQVYKHFIDNLHFFPFKIPLSLDIIKLKYWETKFWQMADKIVAVSESDKEKMLSLVPGLNVGVVPNGAGEDLMEIWELRKKRKIRPVVLFLANFLWLQNIEAGGIFIKKIAPMIKEKRPEIVCRIVGQEARMKLKRFLKDSNVEVCDLKSDNIEGVKKAYHEAMIFVSPLRGPGGTRLKILGAMAAGVPVVSTTVGIKGIEAKDKVEVLIENDWIKFTNAIFRLTQDKSLYRLISSSARRLVEKKYTYEKIAKKLEQIYLEVVRAKKRGMLHYD